MNTAFRIHNGKIVAPWNQAMASALGLALPVIVGGRRLLVAEHGIVETKVLRNFDMRVPAPIESDYNWRKTVPFESQKITAAMLSMEHRAYCLSTMGVGKTRAAMYAYDYLRSKADIGPLLVIAPLSTLVDVWEREVFEVFHHLRAIVLHGTKARRQKLLTEKADVYIINHDGVGVVLAELLQADIGLVVVDELGAFRNAQTARWKILNKLINSRNLPCWGLTGSPTPNAPTDAYGLSKLLTPWRVPRSFRRFQLDTMEQLSQFKWIPKKNANAIAAEALKPSVRFTLEECHDLPPITYSTRHVDMTGRQKTLYEAVAEKFAGEFKSQKITAVNEGAKLQKLLQISAGFVYAKDRGLYVDAGPRMRLVLDLIEEAGKKVLVFASFTWLVHALAEVIGARYSTAIVTGEVSLSKRAEIFASFRSSTAPHVIVADARTMAHGLTLVQADTIIWYGPTMSAETYEQANARIHRPGQDSKTHIVHIESTSVEKRAFSRLQHKRKMQGMLLEILQGEHDE